MTTANTTLIGKPISRVEGRLKVTGAATYTADVPVPNLKHGVFVLSRIANGRIRNIDTTEAERVPGVIGILTHKNALDLNPPPNPQETTEAASVETAINIFPRGPAGETVRPLEEDRVYYWGQHIGIVVADTLEAARRAARLVQVEYDEETPVVMDNLLRQHAEPVPVPNFLAKEFNEGRGDVAQGFTEAEVEVQQTSLIPSIHHVPMENGSTVAVWDGDHLTLYDATQTVRGTRKVIAQILRVPQENVRVIARFVGGGFGGKCMVWTHVPMTAIAARVFNVPVKTVLSREEMFTSMGYRPETHQVIRLGATKEGKLTAIDHDVISQTSIKDDYAPPITHMSKTLYTCPNVGSRQRLYKVNAGTPTIMRAPGEALGLFALESAMDELAYKLKIDPVELRLRNYADKIDPLSGKPWSSKSLLSCYTQGATRFGWEKRVPRPGSMREDGMLVGFGMSSAIYPIYMSPAAAVAKLFLDGRAVVQSATHELGQGAYTVMTQIAAEALGLPIERVEFQLGDTDLPPAPIAGASRSSASVGPAVQAACIALRTDLVRKAIADLQSPLHKCREDEIIAKNGRIFVESEPSRGESYVELMRRQGMDEAQAYRAAFPPDGTQKQFDSMADGITANLGPVTSQYAMYTFGAHFVEVRVDPEVGRVEVHRVTGVYDAGRILNHKLASSQAMGGIMFAIGMALKEETMTDPNLGCVFTASQLDYHVPVIVDAPRFDISFVGEADINANPIGVKSMGEIGTAGTSAAIANAVYHATGKRVLELPISPSKLL